jgi:hypothetical protein
MSPPSSPEFPPLFGPGFYLMSAAELRAKCVGGFPLSTSRSGIMDGLEAVLGKLMQVGVPGELWVDGSFLTHKLDPNDIDLLLRLTNAFVEGVTAEEQAAIEWFIDRERHDTHKCDCYLWVEYPQDHGLYWSSVWRGSYWVRQYGFSRGNDLEGIAVLQLACGAT